ncbi:glycosyltransferase family 4 protein [uncultured Dokdonia sp.]|uniref:glycosyltransferase family 4 protein n=1 Tax=uncultured Dokdonia sp. TaxID=575653 RepID=UPI0026156930|nr:glycosyltransferase family 4 protein [uncultured Dokdonia sp.]
MKILMVSMNSIHFQRWTEQLRDSGHEVHWFDVRGGAGNASLDFVKQHINWKYRFKKGRYLFKKISTKLPFLTAFFERNIETIFKEKLQEIQPDVVHSFALYVSCTPILNVMKASKIPWIYSSWGSDLFYFKDIPSYRRDIEAVLPEINYLFTDCHRDQELAKTLGFSGRSLGVFPGGGGFELEETKSYIKPIADRKLILVKGYQGRSGRAIPILQALNAMKKELNDYEVVVFGCSPETLDFKVNVPSQWIFHKQMSHHGILKLMGASVVYIGNSNSDGMPNTVLEAICMGAFPIQSNPGDATAEVITPEINGLLIEDCEDPAEIEKHILMALQNQELVATAFLYNQDLKKQWERQTIQQSVLKAYDTIKVDRG